MSPKLFFNHIMLGRRDVNHLLTAFLHLQIFMGNSPISWKYINKVSGN